MKVTIKKSIANGSVKAQPSKSYAHRLLIASCLSNDKCVIENVVLSNDILATINCLKALGKDITITGNNIKTLIIKNNENYWTYSYGFSDEVWNSPSKRSGAAVKGNHYL